MFVSTYLTEDAYMKCKTNKTKIRLWAKSQKS